MSNRPKIYYTLTDEAPALATYSWLPIVEHFAAAGGVEVENMDISLAARILASFPEALSPEQRERDAMGELAQLVKTPTANIIKLPNISASLPQLKGAIEELQTQGYSVPDYPEGDPAPETSEAETLARYQRVLGSAVNPVLREGNSDRRVAKAVKKYARKHPHILGEWSTRSKSHVASMTEGDFYSSEKSHIVSQGGTASILWEGGDGQREVLKEEIALEAKDVIDSAAMSCRALREYLAREIEGAKKEGVLLSLHLKATMMKISDPIIFGHAVEVFYRELFEQYGEKLAELGVNSRNGVGDIRNKIKKLPGELREKIESTMARVEGERPPLAMVDSGKGICNLYAPNNIIIDASMPAAIKSSGKMWGPDGELQDTRALIPDRSCAGIYQQVMDYCRAHGAFDVSSMGNVSNVGLMAKKAQEYGSHDKTFEISRPGVVKVVDQQGQVLLQQEVEAGDIWRMCQTKDEAIGDWVKLAVERARQTGYKTIFWLDPERAHDRSLITLVEGYLGDLDTEGLRIMTMSPVEAMGDTLRRVSEGKKTISVTGNVLRDYLTDLFPILELGTSAKMLSIVPLLAGGSLYETGAGGTAPRHIQQFVEENHLRWDSLGEFLALGVSLEDLGRKSGEQKIIDLALALNRANEVFLQMNRSPRAQVGKLDTRGSHFYLALYWAQSLAESAQEGELKAWASKLAEKLQKREKVILGELLEVQGRPVDLGGLYHPDREKAAQAMRPSPLFNALIAAYPPI